ncbi:MAG: recombinase RecT [Bacteroidales bacterium]|nr:recombinase RecT [Bacteroidales bacterium]
MASFLDKLKPIELADNQEVKDKFLNVYMKIHKQDLENADAFYEKEKGYFKQAVLDPESKLTECTIISLYSAFMEIAINGLSIKKQGKAEAYIEAKNQKIKSDKGDVYVKVAKLVIQTHGELLLRKRAGQLLHVSNPVIVYEGDEFQPKMKDGVMVIDYTPSIPRKSNTIVGSFCKLHLPHGIIDWKWLLKEDIQRFQNASIKMLKNEKGNALYTSGVDGQIDVGFLETKTIKHAMNTLGRFRVDSSAVMIEDDNDSEEMTFAEPNETQSQSQSEENPIDNPDNPF